MSFSIATSEKELVLQIRNYFKDLKVTEYDFKTPTSDFIISFYKMFLGEFFIDENSIMQIQMSQMTVFGGEYSEMYNDIIPLINLAEAIKKFQIPALKTFCVFDLIKPTPRRTFLHVSNAMLFINFADSRVAILDLKLNEVAELKIKKQNILKNIEEMRQIYHRRLMEITNKKSGVKDKNSEIEKLRKEIEEMYNISNALDKKSKDIKLQLLERKALHDKNLQEHQMLLNDVQELNSQIKQVKGNDNSSVPSSTVLSVEILEEKAKESTERLKNARENLTSKMRSCEKQKACLHSLNARVELLNEINHSIEMKNEIDKKMEEVCKNIKIFMENIDKKKFSIHSVEEELNNKNEKLSGLRLQWDKEKSSLQESLITLKNDLELLKNIEMEKKSELNDINKKFKYYEEKIVENEKIWDTLLDNIENEHKHNEEKDQEYADNILEFLKELQ